MYYFGKKDPNYTLIECEKCGKVLKFEDKYFKHEENYCIPNALIKCFCGNSTNQTIYSKEQKSNSSQVKCPKCGSTQIQAIPRRWSLLTGFLTNKVDRVCLNCKNKF